MSYSFTITASNTWSYTRSSSNTWSHSVTEIAQTPPEDGIQTKAGGYILTKSGDKIQIKT
jgi:hypothetical protein